MMSSGMADDLRQAFVVTKNEMMKYLRGRKALILAIIILAVWGLVTALPYALGEGMDDPLMSLEQYYGFAWMLVIITVAMFSSGAIVSEFEDRTALVLFTRPIRKGSIFLGKFVAAFVFGAAAILVYALLSAATVRVATGGLPEYTWLAVALMVVTVFAATGVAMLISSVFKRSSTAAIITFFMLFLITNLVSSMLVLVSKDPWYMIEVLAMDLKRSLLYGLETVPAKYDEIMEMSMCVDPSYDAPRSVGVGLAWGLVGTILSFLLFTRKEV